MVKLGQSFSVQNKDFNLDIANKRNAYFPGLHVELIRDVKTGINNDFRYRSVPKRTLSVVQTMYVSVNCEVKGLICK